MAQCAVVDTMTVQEISDTRAVTLNVGVKYRDTDAEGYVTGTVYPAFSWPGLTVTAVNVAIRDAIISGQPSGFNLAAADVLLVPFNKGSLV